MSRASAQTWTARQSARGGALYHPSECPESLAGYEAAPTVSRRRRVRQRFEDVVNEISGDADPALLSLADELYYISYFRKVFDRWVSWVECHERTRSLEKQREKACTESLAKYRRAELP